MDIEALATLLTIEKNNLNIHCIVTPQKRTILAMFVIVFVVSDPCWCKTWRCQEQLVQFLPDHFPKTALQPPTLNLNNLATVVGKKHNFLYNFQLKYFKRRPHLFKRIMLWKEVAKKQKCAPVYKKWKKTSTNTASCRIWIMLRQIFWKTVTGKQRFGQIFRKTERNGRSR